MTRVIGIDASRAFGRQRTGTEQYSFQLLEALGALRPEEDFHLYLNARVPPAIALPENFRFRPMPWPRAWTHLRLSAEMASHPPDVLFVPAHVVPLNHPATVVTIHDTGYRAFPEAHRWSSRLALEWTTRWSLVTARRVITPSRHAASTIASLYGTPGDKLVVVPHGYHPRFRVLEPAAIREGLERLGLCQPYLLFVGTLQPRKNLRRVLEAFARAVAGGIPHRLVLAGQRGWLASPLLQLLEREAPGVRARVRLTGYVDDADLPLLYNGADALIFPSLYEGFGMPALEAMACGTPVLTSNTSSLPEVVDDAALLVDPLDTAAIAAGIIAIGGDAGCRAILRERGLRRAAVYSWTGAASATLDILRDVATVSKPKLDHRAGTGPR